jgi:hypothetical protein
MKKNLAVLFSLVGWFAIIVQFILMIGNSTNSAAEVIIRFFSFFTILTNTLVALYFSCLYFTKNHESKLITKPGILTAITIYITLVCLVYQIALRQIWQPQGLQRIVDELLHSVIPIFVIIFWYMYETTIAIKYSQILKWSIFPLTYLVYILVRGSFSNFYPYPFVDVSHLGMKKVLTNSAVILVAFLIISTVLLFIGKKIIKR